MNEFPYNFDLYLECLKNTLDSYRTYGLVFESSLNEETRKHLIETPITEIRNGVRGVSDDGVLEKQNTFYTIGVFLKFLSEMGFTVCETVEEEWDFCGDITKDNFSLTVDFKYGLEMVEYKVLLSDEREHTGHQDTKEFLEGIFKGGWNLPKFEGVLVSDNLYEDLETFMRDFRKAWSSYKKIVKEKVG